MHLFFVTLSVGLTNKEAGVRKHQRGIKMINAICVINVRPSIISMSFLNFPTPETKRMINLRESIFSKASWFFIETCHGAIRSPRP